MNRPATPQHILALVEDHFDEVDARFTRGRRLVVADLAASSGPRTPADMQAATDLPLSSLYRSLSVLEEVGVVSRHPGADGVIRYEISEQFAGHHHHLVCRACGAMSDVELAPDEESAIRSVAASAAARSGYSVSGHALEIEGLCATCR